jgi:hypothetical protein
LFSPFSPPPLSLFCLPSSLPIYLMPLAPAFFPWQPSSPTWFLFWVSCFFVFLVRVCVCLFLFCFCCFFCLFRYTLWVMFLGFHSNFLLHLSAPQISSACSATHRPLLGIFLHPIIVSFQRPLPNLVSDECMIDSSF